jgi:hypothetical protein
LGFGQLRVATRYTGGLPWSSSHGDRQVETAYDPPPGVQGVQVVRGHVLDADFVSSVISAHDAVARCLGMRYAHPWARRESPDDDLRLVPSLICQIFNRRNCQILDRR